MATAAEVDEKEDMGIEVGELGFQEARSITGQYGSAILSDHGTRATQRAFPGPKHGRALLERYRKQAMLVLRTGLNMWASCQPI